MDKETIDEMELDELLHVETRLVTRELFDYALERAWGLLFGELRALLLHEHVESDAFEDLATIAWHVDAERYRTQWIPYLTGHQSKLPSRVVDEQLDDVPWLYPDNHPTIEAQ